MRRKVITFDLDDTLAVTKSPITDQMSETLGKLLEKFQVCVISGGNFDQFKKQLLDNLHVETKLLTRLHLMPTCGTRYYRYDPAKKKWLQQYAEDLSKEDKALIEKVLTKAAKELGYWEEKPYGEIVQDRGSQVTFSALGQDSPPAEKYKWDPDAKKRNKIRAYAAPLLPHLEVRVGGTTSIDVTKIGIDKAYGMQKLLEALSLSKEEILFFGDKLAEGGNDYPVKAMDIDSIEVSDWEDTVRLISTILSVV